MRKNIKENSFDGAPGGQSGAVTYSTGWGTYSSPSNSQTADHFSKDSKNTAGQQSGGPAGGKAPGPDKPSTDKLQNDVDHIFKKSDTPTPDEVASGLQYELGRMITKDKARAKQIVLGNLKKDPHFYSNLHMLNIDDKKMSVDERYRQANKQEISKIFQEIADARPRKYERMPAIESILKDMIAKKQERNQWKHGLTSEAPKE